MTAGAKPGKIYPLDPEQDNRVGRDADCAVAINDPICSRVHAILLHRDRSWFVRDAESRNGTYVNGQKMDEAMVADGHTLRVGSTEFAFHCTAEMPTMDVD